MFPKVAFNPRQLEWLFPCKQQTLTPRATESSISACSPDTIYKSPWHFWYWSHFIPLHSESSSELHLSSCSLLANSLAIMGNNPLARKHRIHRPPSVTQLHLVKPMKHNSEEELTRTGRNPRRWLPTGSVSGSSYPDCRKKCASHTFTPPALGNNQLGDWWKTGTGQPPKSPSF